MEHSPGSSGSEKPAADRPLATPGGQPEVCQASGQAAAAHTNTAAHLALQQAHQVIGHALKLSGQALAALGRAIPV